MAVTGVFNADFSQFYGAVNEANDKLDSLVTHGAGAGTAVQMSLDQIGASGGRMSGSLAAGAVAASSGVSGLVDKYGALSGVLGAAGLHIGPQITSFARLATVVAEGSAALGFFGTTAALTASALTGLAIGTAISNWLGLTEAINKASVAYQNMMDQTDMAKQDTINRAIAQGAKETIGYTEAIKFNEDAAKRNATAHIDWTQKLADAYKEVRGLNQAQKDGIAIAQEAGATTEQITIKYGVSETALKLLAEQTKRLAADQREAAKASDEHAAALAKLAKEAAAGLADFQAQTDVAKAWAPIIDENIKKRDAEANAAAEQRAASMQQAAALDEEAAAAKALEAENAALIASYTTTGEAAKAGAEVATSGAQATAGAYAGVTQQVNISADAIRGWLALMQYTNQSNAILSRNSLFTTQSQRDELARLPIPSFAGGVDNFEGGLAKVHAGELLVNLPGGTSVIPKGQGGNLTMSNTFNLVDSESNLARRVSELIMRSVRAGTQLGTT